MVYLLKAENDAFGKFKQWKLLIENTTDKKVKTCLTGNELELCNDLFWHLLIFSIKEMLRCVAKIGQKYYLLGILLTKNKIKIQL